jgi:hypothetical protein
MEKIEALLADKEVSSEKMDEMKRREKDEVVRNYVDIKYKKLALEDINAHNMRKELELTLLTEDAKLMAAPLTNDMDPT